MAAGLLLRSLGLLSVCGAIAAFSCSWSNEGCGRDEDCCSRSCFQAHEGTDSRCRHSSLGEPCVFDYHCRDDLICGRFYNCCSPFWKMCMTDADCCDKAHVCRPAEGFIYDRCLEPASGAPTVHPPSPAALLVLAAALLLPVLPATLGTDQSGSLLPGGGRLTGTIFPGR